MAKERYIALADAQTLWTDSIKPWIVGNLFNVSLAYEENAQATSATQPSVTASAATTGKLYLVGPASGTKYQWITLEDKSTSPTSFSWIQIGTTDIDLTTASEQSVRSIVSNYQAGS